MKAEDFLDQEIEPIGKKITSRGMSAEAFLDMPAEEPIEEPAAAPAPTMLGRGKEAVTDFFRPSFAPEPTVPAGMEGMPESAIPAGMPEDIPGRRAEISERLGQINAEAKTDTIDDLQAQIEELSSQAIDGALPPDLYEQYTALRPQYEQAIEDYNAKITEVQGLTGELEDLKQMEYGAEMTRPISTITGKPVPTPEERMLGGITEPGKFDFMDRAREIKEEGVVPFVPFLSGAREVRDIARVSAAAYKLKEGTATDEEKTDLLEFVEKANRDTTFGYKVINTVAAMPAFMGEFLLTSGLYTAGRKVGTKAATKTLENYLGGTGRKLLEKDLGKIGIGIAGGVAGGTLQAPIMGAPRIVSGTIERSMPKLKLSRDEEGGINAVIAGEGEDFLVASTMALGDQWAETVSEHSGGLFRMLNGSAKNAAIRAGLFSATMKANPGMSPNQVNTLFNKMAYHGVINEMLEERVGEGLRAGLGLQEYKIPTAEQLAVELVSFSVPGVIQALGAKAFEKKEVPPKVPPAAPGLSETQRELAKEVIREKMAGQPPVPAIPEWQIPLVSPGMPQPVGPPPTGPAPGILPPGQQGFELIEPEPEVRLRPGPEKIEGPEYPEGAEYVAGRPAPEELEVEYKPILGSHGLPWKEKERALKAFGSKRLKDMGITEETHEVVPVKNGFGITRKVEEIVEPEVVPEVEKKPHEMTLEEFEAAGHRPANITEDQWVDMMRRHRRALGQTEESGTAAAPFADYQAYHAVDVDALRAEKEKKPVVEKPPAKPKKPTEPIMSSELKELHDHRARILGFEKAGGSFVEGYLKKLAKVAEKTDMSAAVAAYEALSEYKKGNINQATLEAEKILGKLHKAEKEALMPKPKVAPKKPEPEVPPEIKPEKITAEMIRAELPEAVRKLPVGRITGRDLEGAAKAFGIRRDTAFTVLKEAEKPTKVPAKAITEATSYDEMVEWIDEKAKEYDGKNKFYASPEYAAIYPVVAKIKAKQEKHLQIEAKKAMSEVGVVPGDRVEYVTVMVTGIEAPVQGNLYLDKKGIPKVKTDEGKVVTWNKGWKKIPKEKLEEPAIVKAVDGAFNARARSNILIEEGRKAVPGIRSQDAEEAGQMSYLVAKGEATQKEFDAWIEQAKKERRIKETKKPEVAPVKKTPDLDLARWVRFTLDLKHPITWRDLYKAADGFYGGTQAKGVYTSRQAFDAMELGMNLWIQKHIEKGMDPVKAIKLLDKKQGALATQTKRTKEQVEFQQFSTPPTHSRAMAWVANIGPNDVVLEPSAGTGSLVTQALIDKPAEVIANELSARRAKLLENLGIKVYKENAAHLNAVLPAEVKPTVVLMNPPFSSDILLKGKKKAVGTGAEHIEQALMRLEEGGRLVALAGRGMALDKPAFRKWWNNIQAQYNVRAVIGISGKEYKKYGTDFDNVLIVIDKTGPTKQPEFGPTIVTGTVGKVEEVVPLLEGIHGERTPARKRRAVEPVVEEGVTGAEAEARPERPLRPPTYDVGVEGEERPAKPGELPGPPRYGGVPRKARPEGGIVVSPARPPARAPGVIPGEKPGERELEAERPGIPSVTPVSPLDVDRRPGIPDEDVTGRVSPDIEYEENKPTKKAKELTDSLFENYVPSVKVKDSQKHPAPIAESAAMAAVDAPKISYRPKIPQSLIDSGKLSDIQLEFVARAGEVHEQIMPDGQRAGIMCGDGTGVGKGAQQAGIILDNWNHGRKKAVWISEKMPLMKESIRDLDWVGMDGENITFKPKVGEKIKREEGVLYTTYSTLASEPEEKQKRLDQVIEWLGRDFDGVICFDESHNMARSTEEGSARGPKPPSKKALAGVHLQAALPNARIVYASATAATEVENLAYAERLSLWGEGTAFPSKGNFIQSIKSGGIAAMEVVASNLKSMGRMVSRTLAYQVPGNPDHTVTYETLTHKINPADKKMYNELAQAWQIVLENIDEALEETGGSESSQAKSSARSQFWGAQQRFFNQVLTSIPVPSLIKNMEKQLASGNSCVLQLYNTNEALANRRIAQAEEAGLDLEDIDLTPRDILMQYLQKSFPVKMWEEYYDKISESTQMRPVRDSAGDIVTDPRAVARRDQLMKDLASLSVPETVMERVINHFGSSNVAEVTGRKRRLVRQPDGTVKEERMTPSSRAKDIDAYMDKKKRILMFSDAGGTGKGYHSDLDRINQEKRIHYLVQAGWIASRALQGFGRSHRTNQRFAPHDVLVTTDIAAHKRFFSSIARRLDQVGALTKGERKTTGQGLFSAEMNLENEYADMALSVLFDDLQANRAEGLDLNTVARQMGFGDISEIEGDLIRELGLTMTRFLNRMLSMEIDEQNKLFDAFYARLEAQVQYAIDQGVYESGIETLRADKIEKISEQDVDVPVGKVKYTELALTYPLHPTTYEHLENTVAFGDRGSLFLKNKRSGKLYFFKRGPAITEAGGTIRQRVVRTSPTTTIYMNRSDVSEEKYEEIPKGKKARKIWDAQVAKEPKSQVRSEYLISGTLLPIWDRLPDEIPRIARVRTDEGEVILGRRIAPAHLAKTKRSLSIGDEKAPEITSKQAIDALMEHDATLVLANNWTIRARTVSGEDRIEIAGPNRADSNMLEDFGAFTEIIGYKLRVFVPLDKATEIIERIIKHKPVVEVQGRAGQALSMASIVGRLLENEKGSSEFINDLSRAGANVMQRGFTKFKDFSTEMRKVLGEAWSKAKSLIRKAFFRAKQILKSEKGAAELRNPFVGQVTDESPSGMSLFDDLEIERTYAQKINTERDEAAYQVSRRTAELEKQVKKLTATGKRKGFMGRGLSAEKTKYSEFQARKLSRAMLYYREAQINPEKAEEFEGWAVEELKAARGERKIRIRAQLESYRQSQDLTDEQKRFVDETMDQAFSEVSDEAIASGIITRAKENYVRRIWDLPKNRSGLAKYGFKTFTTAQLQRKFETIYDGFVRDMDLRISGITGSYGEIAEEVAIVKANKNFIQASMDIGILTTDSKKRGYIPLNASGFSAWARKAGAKIKTRPTEPGLLQIDTHGRKIFFAPPTLRYGAIKPGATRVSKYFPTMEMAEDWIEERDEPYRIDKVQQADVFEKVTLYAPERVGEMLNQMTRTAGGMFETPVMRSLLRFNAGIKGWILMSSFFHHMAGQRSWSFGVNHEIASNLGKGNVIQALKNVGTAVNSVSAHKRGLQKIEANSAQLALLVRQGLTLGKMQDWDEALLREQKGLTETFIHMLGAEKIAGVMEKGRIKREMFTNSLFRRFFAGLKAEAAVTEFNHRVKRATMKGETPNTDLIAEQVARLINADFGGLHLTRMGRSKDMQKMLRLLLLAPDWTESNFRTFTGMVPGANKTINRIIGDMPPPPGMEKVYRGFWGGVIIKGTITTMMAQAVADLWNDDDEDWRKDEFFNNFRRMKWTGVNITGLYRSFDVDVPENERRIFSVVGHFADPLKIMHPPKLIKGKGSPLTRITEALMSKSDWRERPYTSFGEWAATGKLKKKSRYEPKENFWVALPSIAADQVISMQPIQFGHMLRYMMGEQDGMSAVLKSGGFHITTAYKPKMKRRAPAGRVSRGPSGDRLKGRVK